MLALAAPASAQLPVTQGPPPTTPAPPAEAKLSVGIATKGITDHHKLWLLAGDKVKVRGTLTPYVDGQVVVVKLFKGGKHVGHRNAKVTPNKNGAGYYSAVFHINSAGSYSTLSRHEPTDKQKAANSPRRRFGVVAGRAHRGSSGETVRLLQIGLRRLAYVAPVTGRFEAGTTRAVLAFRKVQRWRRNGSASRDVFRRLFRGQGGFNLRYTKGRHLEGDLGRQVLVFADHGKPYQIYTMSSGKPSTPTVRGAFNFYRKQPGTNAHGMVYSSYFHGGYAVHGYPSVPATYPASHGCIRVPVPDARRIYGEISLGERIFVYR